MSQLLTRDDGLAQPKPSITLPTGARHHSGRCSCVSPHTRRMPSTQNKIRGGRKNPRPGAFRRAPFNFIHSYNRQPTGACALVGPHIRHVASTKPPHQTAWLGPTQLKARQCLRQTCEGRCGQWKRRSRPLSELRDCTAASARRRCHVPSTDHNLCRSPLCVVLLTVAHETREGHSASQPLN